MPFYYPFLIENSDSKYSINIKMLQKSKSASPF